MTTPKDRLPPGFDPLQDRLLDPRTLRGLAHPLRLRLRGELADRGPATASQLAGRMGLSSGITSYHLRQLAIYGFVVEEPRRGRERYWRAVHRTTYLDPASLGAAGGEDGGVYLRAVAHLHAERLVRFAEAVDGVAEALGPGWDSAWDMSNWTLALTAAEAADLSRRIHELLAPYRLGDREPSAHTRAVAVQLHILPGAGDGL